MASFRKVGNKWEAMVYKNGKRKAKRFVFKGEAQAWANQMELELSNGFVAPDTTYGQILDRYAKEISVNKKGSRWEQIRINLIKRFDIANVKVADLKPIHFANYRDERLKTISPSSVNRELNLLSHVNTVSVNEWGYLKENPLSKIAKPKKAPHRDRRVTMQEIERLCFVAGYDDDNYQTELSQRVCCAFLFAIETAMRAGEILKLKQEDINFDTRVAVLHDTKNGTSRKVPLTDKAIHILKQLEGNVFNLTSNNLESQFRKLRDLANIDDLHFHDSRHEAITRLAKKVDVLDLARIVGHKDLRYLMVYYNEQAEDIVKRL